MSLKIGIVGLPNVGKSTLFKALTKKEVDIANYPFCTIDPNAGVVLVPDERVDKLAELSKSEKKIYATVDFVDIAGLVKGAAKGEGLGNKFLSHIREVDAVLYVLRAFKNPDIVNTQQEVNPKKEKEILDIELIFKDSETIDKRIQNLESDVRAGKKEAMKEMQVLNKAKDYLAKEKILSECQFSDEEIKILKNYQLLTSKPRLYLLNGKAEEINKSILEEFFKNKWEHLIADVGITDSAESELDALIQKSYKLLNLITFLTTGEKETRAWTVVKDTKAPEAAGVIHSDFEKNFVKAEIIFWKSLYDSGSYLKARQQGLIRTEGKNYVVQDGDVIEFKHG